MTADALLLHSAATCGPRQLAPAQPGSSERHLTVQVLVVIARLLPTRHADLRPLFEMLDADHSGFLSLRELEAGLKVQGVQARGAAQPVLRGPHAAHCWR